MTPTIFNPYRYTVDAPLSESLIVGGIVVAGGYGTDTWETYNQATTAFTQEASVLPYVNSIMAGGGNKASSMVAGGLTFPSNTTNSATNTAGTWITNAYALPAALGYAAGGGSPSDFLICGGSGHGNIYANACWENNSGAWVSGGTLGYQSYGKGFGGNSITAIVAGGNGVGGSSGNQDITETYASSTWTTSSSVLQSGRHNFGMDGNVDGAIYMCGYGSLGYGQGNQCGTWSGGASGSWTTVAVLPTVAPANTMAAANFIAGNDTEAVGGTGAGASYTYIPYMFEWNGAAGTWTRVGDLNIAREYAAGGMAN